MTIWGKAERKTYLNAEDEDWHLQTWLWMLRHFGGTSRLKNIPLVTPTDDFFPTTDLTGEKRAGYIFDRVKRFMGLSGSQIELIVQPEPPPFLATPDSPSEAGTFLMDDGKATISFAPELIDEPLKLVATFAHELCHFQMSTVSEPPPDDSEMREYATDLMTVYFGFGIFGADCAFNFWQGPGGGRTGGPWGCSTLGYLRESDWVFALAVFLNLRGQDCADFDKWLKDSMYCELKDACAFLASNPNHLAELRRVV
jgi:hypothetical protein